MKIFLKFSVSYKYSRLLVSCNRLNCQYSTLKNSVVFIVQFTDKLDGFLKSASMNGSKHYSI